MLRTSPILHSGGAASRSFAQWMTSVFWGFRSAPTLVLATSGAGERFGFRVSTCDEQNAATGGDVCRVLKRLSDGWVRPPIRCPD